MVASVGLAFGLVEAAGRLLLTPLIAHYSKNKVLKLQLSNPQDLGIMSLYLPHPYYLYAPRPNYRSEDGTLRHNSLGCRAEEAPVHKPKNVYRIITLGGSTTYSTGVRRNEEVYTYKLEKQLTSWAQRRGLGKSFEVLNCGVPGYTSAENLSRYIFSLSEYEPDLVIVQQGLNDTQPRELPHLSRDYREYSKIWEEVDSRENRWFLMRVARLVKNRLTDSLWTKGINLIVRRPFWDKKRSGTDSANYSKNPPWIFESNTRYLVRLIQEDGARALLMTEHVVTDKAMPGMELPNSRIKATLEHNQVLKQVAQEENGLFFDLQSKLCACEAIMPDGRHLNEQGETLKAQALFEYLTCQRNRHGLPPRKSRPHDNHTT